VGVWGVVRVVCVCVSVSGVLFPVGVCVCDLLICLLDGGSGGTACVGWAQDRRTDKPFYVRISLSLCVCIHMHTSTRFEPRFVC